MTQSKIPMERLSTVLLPVLAALLLAPGVLQAQAPQESADSLVVGTDHPRLFLRPGRLRLLKRERERTSMRWQQFETLMSGNAPVPEPGFAQALYYAISGDQASGKRAVTWALGPGADLRQLALVFDWCQELLSETQQHELAAKMEKLMAAPSDGSIPAMRSRTLAAVALFDHVPNVPQRELEQTRTWWNSKIAAPIKGGHDPIPREDAFALMELLHAVRDNTNVDFRESSGAFFKDFPIYHLLSYYPAAWPAPENDYYIGASRKSGDPDLRAAALSRAADLAMVAYDVNAAEMLVLQGWLMHDKFMLRGPFGVPYEFLWANPYEPGLSYYHVPLVYYNPDFGRLFIRSSWDENAIWFGYWDGAMQLFDKGTLTTLNPQLISAPMSLGEAAICLAHSSRRFEVKLDEEDAVFVIGLKPRTSYRIEVDDEEMFEDKADPGGILALTDVPRGKAASIRLKELP